MPIAETGNLRIYYEQSTPDDRDAPKLLFISGTGADLRVRPGVMDGPLARNFNLIAYDQRGLGQSEVPEGPWTMAQYADDAAALMDHVGWQRAHIYGASFGGMVAQNLVLRHAHRVDKLVLACTSPGGEGAASYPLHTLGHMEPKERFLHMLGIYDNRINRQWQKENPERVEKMWNFTQDQRKHIPVTQESERGAFLQLDARQHHDASGGLGDIKSDAFICGGKYDDMAPPSNHKMLHQGIANSNLKFYEGGHLFLLQDPQAIKDIRAFLLAPTRRTT